MRTPELRLLLRDRRPELFGSLEPSFSNPVQSRVLRYIFRISIASVTSSNFLYFGPLLSIISLLTAYSRPPNQTTLPCLPTLLCLVFLSAMLAAFQVGPPLRPLVIRPPAWHCRLPSLRHKDFFFAHSSFALSFTFLYFTPKLGVFCPLIWWLWWQFVTSEHGLECCLHCRIQNGAICWEGCISVRVIYEANKKHAAEYRSWLGDAKRPMVADG